MCIRDSSSIQSDAFTAIANDPNVQSDPTGFTLTDAILYDDKSNTCKFDIYDSSSGGIITAIVTYAMATSITDKTATIRNINIS